MLIFFCGGDFNVGGQEYVQLVLYASLRLQIPCTYNLPTLYICSPFNRRRIWNPLKHLRWSFLHVKAVGYFRRRAPAFICDRMFDRVLNATLPNNLSELEEGLMRSFPLLELHKGILDSLCLLIFLINTNSSSR